eukprot:TRINITY_DN1868_c0_g1_i1.p2 TRINITY_DN1868_c0_g1~~TRINITY_DN1868_c0_g1_i1.p2  ORF type:complete len:352 (+),score=132.79 TRINITY_DN1868_c0_g1_i1:1743-2798(+)
MKVKLCFLLVAAAAVIGYLTVFPVPGGLRGGRPGLIRAVRDGNETGTKPAAPPAPRHQIVYVVFPAPALKDLHNDRHPLRVEAIRETWGQAERGVDGIAFVGEGDFVIPAALNASHVGAADVIKWALETALAKWPGLDYLVKADDLTFMIPENLRAFVAGRDPRARELMGRRLKIPEEGGYEPKGKTFCSGGAGYALSRAAVDYIVAEYGQQCEPTGYGDIAFAECLAAAGAVVDTRDPPGAAGGERFHMYAPQRTMAGKADAWSIAYTAHWYDIPPGAACCARPLISFHYIDYTWTRMLDDVLRHPRKYAAMTDAERRAAWPPVIIPFNTPPEEEDAMWDLLLRHITIAA